MSATAKGIVYPTPPAHIRVWEHFEALAQSADDAIGTITVTRRGDAAGLIANATQSLATSTWARVTTLAPDSYFPTIGSTISNAGGVLRVNAAGFYLVCGAVNFPTNATGRRGVAFDKNASATAAWSGRHQQIAATAASQAPYIPAADLIYCAAGDYIRLFAYQESGGALTLPTGSTTFIKAVAR